MGIIEEIFKPIFINGIETHYEISNKGNVRNSNTGKIHQPGVSNCGYLRVGIYYVKDNTSENGYFVKGWVWIFEISYEIDTETNQYKFKLFAESADSSHNGVYSNYYKMK